MVRGHSPSLNFLNAFLRVTEFVDFSKKKLQKVEYDNSEKAVIRGIKIIFLHFHWLFEKLSNLFSFLASLHVLETKFVKKQKEKNATPLLPKS